MEKRNVAKANTAKSRNRAGQAKVLAHKKKIQNIRVRLKTESDLRRVNDSIVETFAKDLRLSLKEIKKLDKTTIKTCFNGFHTFCTRIDEAITQLDVALDAAVRIRKEFNRNIQTQYYECLKICRLCLESALLEILI